MTWQASTRKLETVVKATADRTNLSATITFEDASKRTLGVVFSAAVIPATIGVLAARLDELVGDMDHPDRPEMQTLQTSSLQIAMNKEGQTALLIGLQGGGVLPIQFERELLATLKTQCEEVLQATDPRRRN